MLILPGNCGYRSYKHVGGGNGNQPIYMGRVPSAWWAKTNFPQINHSTHHIHYSSNWMFPGGERSRRETLENMLENRPKVALGSLVETVKTDNV